MPDLITMARQFRAALLKRERTAAVEIVKAYSVAAKALEKEIAGLLEKIETARGAGVEVRESWLHEADRLNHLLNQVEVEISRASAITHNVIISTKSAALDAALSDSLKLMNASLNAPAGVSVSFATLPRNAVEFLVGALQDGSPLNTLLNEIAPEAATVMRNALINGLVSGHSTQQIARELRGAVGGSLTRSMTIARTETLRAYREASRANYEKNSDVVKGWLWMSALTVRTCASCWAMHGSLHKLDEVLDHPNGRCVAVPVTKTWAELGFPGIEDKPVQMEAGESAFAKMSEDDQRAILGKSAFNAYQNGAVKLGDFVGQKSDEKWGTMRYRRSLREILGADAAQYVQ
jgi:SPP1 gp7 family putative phage head morphogenesis protein